MISVQIDVTPRSSRNKKKGIVFLSSLSRFLENKFFMNSVSVGIFVSGDA